MGTQNFYVLPVKIWSLGHTFADVFIERCLYINVVKIKKLEKCYVICDIGISGQVTHDNSWGRLNNYVTLKVEISTPYLPVFVMLHFQHFKYVTDVSLTFSN